MSQRAHDRRRLTPKQLSILTYIRDYHKSHGYAPTMQEMADELGVTKVTIFEHVEALIDKGLLRRLPHKARSLELTSRATLPDESSTTFPVIGYIAAGAPIESLPQHESLELEGFFNTKGRTFVLKVRGDSMIDEQIRDGDYVICEERHEARQGETVVAMLDSGEVTLKKYFKESNGIRLQPANSKYRPIYAKEVAVQGVVRGVLRSY